MWLKMQFKYLLFKSYLISPCKHCLNMVNLYLFYTVLIIKTTGLLNTLVHLGLRKKCKQNGATKTYVGVTKSSKVYCMIALAIN